VVVDGGDGAALAGDDAGGVVGGEGEDAVTGGVAATGDVDLGPVEPAGGRPAGAGALVEGGDVGALPGEQQRVGAGVLVGEPAVDRLVERLVPGGSDVDPAVVEVPVDGGVGVAGAEVTEGGALGGVALADVLAQGVHAGGVARDEGSEASTASRSGSSVMPASSTTTAVRASSVIWPWASRQRSDATVCDRMLAAAANVRAACPLVAVPTTV
jgi:hypothetical protein